MDSFQLDGHVWYVGFITAILLFQLVAIPAILKKRNDYADVLWGPAFFITAFAASYFGKANGLWALSDRSSILLLVIFIWATRLFLHVGYRNLGHSREDVRYNNWRKEWGKHWLLRSYLQVFVLQALILYTFITPVLYSLSATTTAMSWMAWFGLATWVIGFLFEALADGQLRRFKSDIKNKGKLMTTGLWSWSRHPNYFGEVVQWWGIWLLVIDLPYAWTTIISPIGVTYLILKVSGVSMLEELMHTRPGFKEYARKTSIFFPYPPTK